MTSSILPALEVAPMLLNVELSFTAEDTSPILSKALHSLAELFCDHYSSPLTFPITLPPLATTIQANGVYLKLKGYRLRREDAVIYLDGFVQNPLDGHEDGSYVAIMFFSETLLQPTMDICGYRGATAGTSIVFLLMDIIERIYPQMKNRISSTARSTQQLSKLAAVMAQNGKHFSLYFIADGIHLRTDGTFLGQWLLPTRH